jgi:hypothetical protein
VRACREHEHTRELFIAADLAPDTSGGGGKGGRGGGGGDKGSFLQLSEDYYRAVSAGCLQAASGRSVGLRM